MGTKRKRVTQQSCQAAATCVVDGRRGKEGKGDGVSTGRCPEHKGLKDTRGQETAPHCRAPAMCWGGGKGVWVTWGPGGGSRKKGHKDKKGKGVRRTIR